MDTKNLLKVRETIKAKKPKFGRKDSNKKPRIESDVWRKARGCDNKQRLKRKGHKKTPKQGYRSPVEIRGMDASGVMPVLVTNPAQLSTLTKEHGIIVSSLLGNKKRKLVLEEANKKGIPVLNLDSAKSLEQINAEMAERQQNKKKQEEEKKKVTEKPKKEQKATEKKTEAKQDSEEVSDEDKKKQEKEEKDKVLTMKQ